MAEAIRRIASDARSVLFTKRFDESLCVTVSLKAEGKAAIRRIAVSHGKGCVVHRIREQEALGEGSDSSNRLFGVSV